MVMVTHLNVDESTTYDVRNVTKEDYSKILKTAAEDFKIAAGETRKVLSDDTVYFLLKQPYFAHIVVETKKVIDTRVPWAAVNIIRGISHLYINPETYPTLPKAERVGILMHEMFHLTFGHLFDMEGKNLKMYNIATDCSINQLVPRTSEISLPDWVIMPDTLRKQGIECADKLTSDEYYSLLKQNQEKAEQITGGNGQGECTCPKCGGSGEDSESPQNEDATDNGEDAKSNSENENKEENAENGNGSGGEETEDSESQNGTGSADSSEGKESTEEGEGAGKPGKGTESGSNSNQCSECGGTGKVKAPENWHSKWQESEGSKQVNEAAIKKQMRDAYMRYAGTIPGDVLPYIKDMIQSKINWESKMRMFVAKFVQSGSLSTFKRENRRLGGLAKGRRKTRKLHIAVMVDTSGSVSDGDLAKFTGEIKAMWATGTKITIMECDYDVHNVYEFNGKIENLKYEGRGGTSFIPPFKKIKDDKMNVDACIYLTDGEGQAPDKYDIPTMWVLLPNKERPHDSSGNPVKWGSVVNITE